MSIEQHAEAAADEIGDEHGDPNGTPVEVIVFRRMQSAIDEATAPLRARIAVLEGLGPLIEEYAGERMKQAEAEAIDEWGDRKMFENRAGRVKAKIDSILTGGAP